jgi:hypothetical protein
MVQGVLRHSATEADWEMATRGGQGEEEDLTWPCREVQPVRNCTGCTRSTGLWCRAPQRSAASLSLVRNESHHVRIGQKKIVSLWLDLYSTSRACLLVVPVDCWMGQSPMPRPLMSCQYCSMPHTERGKLSGRA